MTQIEVAIVCLASLALVTSTIAAPSSAPFTSASAPAFTATTQVSASSKLPAAYSIFETIDPFSAKKHSSAGSSPPGIEDTIILSGTARSDSGWTAFFQDTASKAVTLASVGDAVARGKLTEINLDSVSYVADGKSTHVQVGQNLNGKIVASPATSQPTASPGGQPDQPPVQPANGQPTPGGKRRRPHGGEPTPQPQDASNSTEGEQDH